VNGGQKVLDGLGRIGPHPDVTAAHEEREPCQGDHQILTKHGRTMRAPVASGKLSRRPMLRGRSLFAYCVEGQGFRSKKNFREWA